MLPNLNLGIRSHDLDANSFEEMLYKARNYGFTNLQFAPSKLHYLNISDNLRYGQSRFLSEQIQKNNLEVSILGCYVNIIDNDNVTRNNALKKFNNYLDMSRYFDNAIVATETGSVSNKGYTIDNFSDEAFLKVVKSVKLMAKHAELMGAILAVEPGLNHPLYSIERTIQLLELVDSPNLKLIFDPVNLLSRSNIDHQDDLITTFLHQFKDYICAFHLKDLVVNGDETRVVSFGKGCLNKQLLLANIREYFPHDYCLLEGINEKDISYAIKLINKILG